MALPPNLLASLICPHPKDVFERLVNGSKNKGKAVWSWKTEITPADLYCYLTARFGRPNGPQNFFRKDGSDNLIHWEWVLDSPQGDIHIMGMNFRTELWVSGDFKVSDSDSAEFAAAIKADFSNYGPKMSEVRKSLESWAEFVNPYQRIRRSIENLRVDLNSLDLQPESEKVPDITSSDEVLLPDKWKGIFSKYSKGLGLCFGIRSMLPVMAEAYVNLLLFVLMRPEIKADERLKENTIRQPIDVRVKSLHISCIGFAKPVDYTNPECKAYHNLVNERNDLLHGNVVLDKLRFNEVYFYGNVPVFKEYRSMWERSVGIEINAVGLHRLSAEVETVNAFIEYLASCMKPEVKKQIDVMSEKLDLGWNQKTGRIGVLFPDHLIDMHMAHGEQPTNTDQDG